MTEIKKVNSLEELKGFEIVESEMNGKKLSNPMIFQNKNFEWYTFIKKNEANNNILRIEMSDSYTFEGKDGAIEIGGANTILTEYTREKQGYHYYKSLIINRGLWEKQK